MKKIFLDIKFRKSDGPILGWYACYGFCEFLAQYQKNECIGSFFTFIIFFCLILGYLRK